MTQQSDPNIRLRPWSEGDLSLLEKLMGDPEMTEHLGGPETPEQIAKRHQRYLAMQDPTKGQMFVILAGPNAEPAGSVGYWETDWQGELGYEVGWSMLPAFQGQGIATQATLALISVIRSQGNRRFVHAFPKTTHPASNAVCRKAGFSFIGEFDFEYPKGHPIRCNDWRIDLFPNRPVESD